MFALPTLRKLTHFSHKGGIAVWGFEQIKNSDQLLFNIGGIYTDNYQGENRRSFGLTLVTYLHPLTPLPLGESLGLAPLLRSPQLESHLFCHSLIILKFRYGCGSYF